jgi:hypothetical protein
MTDDAVTFPVRGDAAVRLLVCDGVRCGDAELGRCIERKRAVKIDKEVGFMFLPW